VDGSARGHAAVFDMEIPSGQLIFAQAESHGVQRLFTNLLKRFENPQGGFLTLGGHDILSIDVLTLRRFVMVLDRPTVVEMSIRNYLALANHEASSAQMLEALSCVGLDRAIRELQDGLNTELSVTGWPLSVAETMRLKLAAAILAQPKVLILNQLFDTLPEETLRRAVDHLCLRCGNPPTVIVFSSLTPRMDFDRYLYLGRERQILSKTPLGIEAVASPLPAHEEA
jgi:putative ABC transport system ATP-binding protein